MFLLSVVSIGALLLFSKQLAGRSPVEQVDYVTFNKYAQDHRILGDVKIRSNVAHYKYRSPA